MTQTRSIEPGGTRMQLARNDGAWRGPIRNPQALKFVGSGDALSYAKILHGRHREN
jgi:hypothetical protein